MTQNKRRIDTKMLCIMGLMTAMYIILSKFFSIHIGNLRITFGSLPIILVAMLFGPLPAAAIAFVGEFLLQLLGYGFTPTTVLWCIPPVFRAVIVGFGWRAITKRGANTAVQTGMLAAILILSAIVVTLSNTLVIWLDSVIFNYFTEAYVFGQFAARLVTGIVTAVVMTVVALPLEKAIRRVI